jgi:hypothetical protein
MTNAFREVVLDDNPTLENILDSLIILDRSPISTREILVYHIFFKYQLLFPHFLMSFKYLILYEL